MPRGRIPTKNKLSQFEVHRKELKEACGALDKKVEPAPFNNKVIENMSKLYGKIIDEKLDRDTDKDLVNDMAVSIKDYVIGGTDILDTEYGKELFCRKGVSTVGASMISAKRLLFLTVLKGIDTGISAKEMCWIMYHPERQMPFPHEVFTLFRDFVKVEWVRCNEDIVKSDGTDDALFSLTDEGLTHVQSMISMLNECEKTALRIGSTKRVALILRERKAGRGYQPMPVVDNSKPAFDRVRDVLQLGEFLLNAGGGKDKEVMRL